MRRNVRSIALVVPLLGLLVVPLLAACGATPAVPTVTTSPLATPVGAAGPTQTPIISSTAALSATAVVTGTPVMSATASTTNTIPAGGSLVVTLDNQGQTIALHVGDSFLLNLGDQYQWTVTIDNQAVVSRVIGITVIRGAQGVYEARQAGNATLTATGDPVCRTAQPPCEQPSRQFTVHLVVQ